MSYPDNATASLAQFLFRDSQGAMYIIPRRAFHNGAEYGDAVTIVQDLSGNGNDLTGTAVFDRRSFFGGNRPLDNVRDAQFIRDVNMSAPLSGMGTTIRAVPGELVMFDEGALDGGITGEFSVLILIDRTLSEREKHVVTELARLWGGANWTPGALFPAGKDGFWLDPSDHSTLWIDEERTQNATQPGDVIWHIDDKSGNENHFSVESSADRARLVRWPASAVREGRVSNLLAFTEDSSAWNNSSGETIITGGIADPDGGNNAIRIEDGGLGGDFIRANIPYAATLEFDQDYTLTVRIKWNGVGGAVRALIVGGYSTITGQLTPGEWSDVTLTEQANGGARSNLFFRLNGGGVIEVYQPQVEEGDTPTPYQRVGAGIWDVTEAGQPDCWGILANGVNTRYISERGIPEYEDGKLRMLVGQTKQRPDSVQNGNLISSNPISSANNSFSLYAHLTQNRSYLARYKSTSFIDVATGGGTYPSPHTGILDQYIDSGGGINRFRINDDPATTNTGPSGTIDSSNPMTLFGIDSWQYEGILWSLILTAYAPDETLWNRVARDWLNSANMQGVLDDD